MEDLPDLIFLNGSMKYLIPILILNLFFQWIFFVWFLTRIERRTLSIQAEFCYPWLEIKYWNVNGVQFKQEFEKAALGFKKCMDGQKQEETFVAKEIGGS